MAEVMAPKIARFFKPKYPAAAAISTTAAITMIFLLAPESDVGACPIELENAGGSISSETASWISGRIFAGAAAAAAPWLETSTGRFAEIDSFRTAALALGSVAASDACFSADAMGSAMVFEAGCHGDGFALARSVVAALPAIGSGIDSSSAASVGSGFTSGSASSSNCEPADATGAGGATGVGAGVKAGIFGASLVLANAGFELGVAVGEGAALGSLIAGKLAVFEPSVLRNKPRATRSVPFDCSTLIGLVRTRFAPMRNALATPLWPSTTATDSDVWFDPEFFALLNNKVAFCSFSQSTTTASKCSAINRLTAANGSLHGSTWNSSSVNTWVTTRAVFSSGQNNRAL